MTKTATEFLDFYSKRQGPHLYPTEFVIRAFLGTYPNLKLDQTNYPGSKVLDLGYGDGRNLPLLNNLGFELYGVEISEQLSAMTRERLRSVNIEADLRYGTNRSIPFEDAFFDYVLACHSCHYVEDGSTFKDNLAEIARVSRKDATLVCSLPMMGGYILKDAKPEKDGHYRITNDPYKLRNNVLFRVFPDEDQIVQEFSPLFNDLRIGFCDDNYWGINVKAWIVVGTRR
ncbi:MAG: class I SAM-dependent methyltransferase [Rickettsiales bacterium]|jgi:SAM-dependent methyltransferase|nr:class I SAM-dependent methyltransferase [Rickettsiales bacterium]